MFPPFQLCTEIQGISLSNETSVEVKVPQRKRPPMYLSYLVI